VATLIRRSPPARLASRAPLLARAQFRELAIVHSQTLEEQLPTVHGALGQDSPVSLGQDCDNHNHLLQAQDGRGILKEGERAKEGNQLEKHSGHTQDVGDLEKARNGLLLQVAELAFVVGQAFEDILE
jgi:hypothetical protein